MADKAAPAPTEALPKAAEKSSPGKPSSTRCSCGSQFSSHVVRFGILFCPKTWSRVRKVARSYQVQLVCVVLLTLSLPSLVGHLHPEGETRAKDNLLQPLWSWSITTFPEAASHYIFGSILACTTFFISCIYFSYKDLARHDSKIQKDWWPTLHDMWVVGLPQVVIYIAANWATLVFVDGKIHLPDEAPSMSEFMCDLAIMLVVGDYYIYFEHRTVHHFHFLRDNIHSVHHEYKKVFSWAGGWVHPLEDGFAVLTQIACPVFFLHPHPLTFWVFVCLWTLFLVDEHSGHDVWWSPYYWLPFAAGGGGAPHDIHHYRPNLNFGFVFCIWDIIFCTLTPPVEWYPGKTDFEPYVGGEDFKPVKGFVPVEGWKKYNKNNNNNNNNNNNQDNTNKQKAH